MSLLRRPIHTRLCLPDRDSKGEAFLDEFERSVGQSTEMLRPYWNAGPTAASLHTARVDESTGQSGIAR